MVEQFDANRFKNFLALRQTKLSFSGPIIDACTQITEKQILENLANIRSKQKKKVQKLYPGTGDRLMEFSFDGVKLTHEQMLREASKQSTWIHDT